MIKSPPDEGQATTDDSPRCPHRLRRQARSIAEARAFVSVMREKKDKAKLARLQKQLKRKHQLSAKKAAREAAREARLREEASLQAERLVAMRQAAEAQELLARQQAEEVR